MLDGVCGASRLQFQVRVVEEGWLLRLYITPVLTYTAQLCRRLQVLTKAWVWPPALHKLGVVVRICNPSPQELDA